MDDTRALIPVQAGVQPIIGVEQRGIRNFRNGDQRQDGIIFRGYGPYDEDRIYGRSGKKVDDPTKSRGIIDIYV